MALSVATHGFAVTRRVVPLDPRGPCAQKHSFWGSKLWGFPPEPLQIHRAVGTAVAPRAPGLGAWETAAFLTAQGPGGWAGPKRPDKRTRGGGAPHRNTHPTTALRAPVVLRHAPGTGGGGGAQKVRCGTATVLQLGLPSHGLHRPLSTLRVRLAI